MESMESLRERVEALEHHTHQIEQQLRWWRTLACGLVVLGLLSLPLPSGTAQEGITAQSDTGLAHRVAELADKLQHLASTTNAEGVPEVVISGANLRIVNGLGSTDCTDEEGNEIPGCPNGLGNLIVGYNEPRGFEENIRTGSHNIVVGREHNFSSVGGLVAGLHNEISGEFALVSGGAFNTASGLAASVSGGELNTASGLAASVSGGRLNTASGEHASVSGGIQNIASGLFASVSGGAVNTASGGAASISGGFGNTASGESASVSGGQEREASGQDDWAAGPLFADF